MNERHDEVQEIIDAALRELATEEGDGFDPQACNIAEFCTSTRASLIKRAAHDLFRRSSTFHKRQLNERNPLKEEMIPVFPARSRYVLCRLPARYH